MMNNGCICCTVRGDLIRILGSLKEKRDEGKLEFDRVVIETTGMADPGPVAQTFFTRRRDRNYYLLDSIITHGRREARARSSSTSSHEAQEQVGFADRFCFQDRSRIEDEASTPVQKTEKDESARADQEVHFGDMPIEEVLDIRGFNLNAILQLDPEFSWTATTSITTRSNRSCSSRQALRRPEAGAIPLGNDPGLRPGSPALQGGALDEGQSAPGGIPGGAHDDGRGHGQAWGKNEKKGSVMVFIGKKLPKDIFLAGMEECLAK